MMPGVGFEEMILLVIVAIVVIGPKDLPLMMRKFGRFTGKMRAMAFEFKQGFDELGRQAELEELRKEVADLKKATGLDELRKEMQAEASGLQQDVNNVMRDTPKPAPSAAPEEPKPVAPFAGLSADHPGYDAGDDFRIDGSPVPPTQPGPSGAEAEVHVVPDEDVRPPAPAAFKQDTPA